MNEYFSHDGNGHSHQNDYSSGDSHHYGDHQPHDYNVFSKTPYGLYGNDSILHLADPLSAAHKFSMPPLKLHYVKPHLVSGYTREDGTVVGPYVRDGDGGGYLRTNPDGIVTNNLNYLFRD